MPFTTWNGPAPTTAAQQSVTPGTAIKTMLQLATPATRQIQILEWGFSLGRPARRGRCGGADADGCRRDGGRARRVRRGEPGPERADDAAHGGSTTATGLHRVRGGHVDCHPPFDVVSLSSVSGESGLSATCGRSCRTTGRSSPSASSCGCGRPHRRRPMRTCAAGSRSRRWADPCPSIAPLVGGVRRRLANLPGPTRWAAGRRPTGSP
jgi:hypothetical protein